MQFRICANLENEMEQDSKKKFDYKAAAAEVGKMILVSGAHIVMAAMLTRIFRYERPAKPVGDLLSMRRAQ